ncbi:MAG: hypothetical protein AAF518_15910 [Spirochaetota bacterium]
MATGTSTKHVSAGGWRLLKWVTGKHLRVTIESVIDNVSQDLIVDYELQSTQNTFAVHGTTSQPSLYLPKRYTWLTGGIRIKIPFNTATVTYAWSTGKDAAP